MPTIITICETCKREGWADRNVSETDGLKFAKMIEQKLTPKTKSIWHPYKSHFRSLIKEWQDES